MTCLLPACLLAPVPYSSSRFNKACKSAVYGGTVNSPEGYLLALWVHECRRVFADKLINLEDKAWVDKTINDLCRQEFPPELCKQASGGCLLCTRLYRHNRAAYALPPPSTATANRQSACPHPALHGCPPPPPPTHLAPPFCTHRWRSPCTLWTSCVTPWWTMRRVRCSTPTPATTSPCQGACRRSGPRWRRCSGASMRRPRWERFGGGGVLQRAQTGTTVLLGLPFQH